MLNCGTVRVRGRVSFHLLIIESPSICVNVTEVFSALFFSNVLQNRPSGLLYAVLDALPESKNFPNSGGFVKHF